MSDVEEHDFGKLKTFVRSEYDKLVAIEHDIASYLARPSPERPLCIAVFGPPGSGKSFGVKQIRAQLEKNPEVRLSMLTLNLGQHSDPDVIGRMLEAASSKAADKLVPLVFFDEFDAPRDGVPLGWLSWLLAPMHDGSYAMGGREYPLKRAIYVFAGGTASSYAEFVRPRDPARFREAKGPDFVSRLRGYIDVLGPNAFPRDRRREVILDLELAARAASAKVKRCVLDDALRTSLLRVGRYVHGARSMSALVELMTVAPPDGEGNAKLTHEHLPPKTTRAMHIDNGPLDPNVIGGLVGISLGGPDERVARAGRALASAVWADGGALSYGGHWNTASFSNDLVAEHESLPHALHPDDAIVRLHSFPPHLPSIKRKPDVDPPAAVRIEDVDGARDDEAKLRAGTPDDAWLADVLALFRMRLQVTEQSAVRIALGGKSTGFSGRMPGLWEEVMLALAAKQPVYLLGLGVDCATRTLGQWLALERPWLGEPLDLGSAPARQALLERIDAKLRPPPFGDTLPIAADEVARFFEQHALGTELWPDNGLSARENRTLFAETDVPKAVELVMLGLRRRFG